jgi:MFS family permease
MARFMMAASGALLLGVAMWFAVGMAAAEILARTSNQNHDGGAEMAGFFFIGGMGGLVGAALGAWIVWRLLANPARTGGVGAGMFLFLLALGGAIAFAMGPPPSQARHDFAEGKRGELQVEVKFPADETASTVKSEAIHFELRNSRGLLSAPGQTREIRQEDSRTVLPGAFRVEAADQWTFAIMSGEKQIETGTVGIDRIVDTMTQSTAWSDWLPGSYTPRMDVRWRFAVLPK